MLFDNLVMELLWVFFCLRGVVVASNSDSLITGRYRYRRLFYSHCAFVSVHQCMLTSCENLQNLSFLFTKNNALLQKLLGLIVSTSCRSLSKYFELLDILGFFGMRNSLPLACLSIIIVFESRYTDEWQTEVHDCSSERIKWLCCAVGGILLSFF